jgi:hypothetical protein
MFNDIVIDVKASQQSGIYKIGIFANFASIENDGFCFVLLNDCFRQKKFLLFWRERNVFGNILKNRRQKVAI